MEHLENDQATDETRRGPDEAAPFGFKGDAGACEAHAAESERVLTTAEQVAAEQDMRERGCDILRELILAAPTAGLDEVKFVAKDSTCWVEASGSGGEPHTIWICLQLVGGERGVKVVACPHLESVAERILQTCC